MNSVESLLRGYLEACTPDDVELRGLAEPAAHASPRRPRRMPSLVPVLASVAAAGLLVGGVVVVREQLVGPDAVVPPADGVLFDGSVPTDLLGTWVVLGQPSADTADLERQVRITFLPDGSWYGWDGCNSVDGTYDVQRGGTLSLDDTSTTPVLCTKPLSVTLPRDGELQFEVGTSRVTLRDGAGDGATVLWRPGGQFNPTARLSDDGSGDWRLEVTTWGQGGCFYMPSDVTYAGTNQLTVEPSESADRPCDDFFGQSTRSTSVDESSVDVGSPITVTLNGLYPAPVTVPVDASRVDANAGHSRSIDLGVVLVNMGRFGARRAPNLVTSPTTVPATGDTGWDAVNALLTTGGQADVGWTNGWNIGYHGAYPAAEVNEVVVGDDVITVDLDRDVGDPYPTVRCMCPSGELMMQQLVWTLDLALSRDLPVALTVNGQPARVVSGYHLNGPVAADPAFRPGDLQP